MRKIHRKAVLFFSDFISTPEVDKLTRYLDSVVSEYNCPLNTTPRIIHDNIQYLSIEAGIKLKEYDALVKSFKVFLGIVGFVPEFLGEEDGESMSDAFDTYISDYYNDMPEGKDLTGELITLLYFYLSGVAEEDVDILGRSDTFKTLQLKLKEKSSYSSLMNEYTLSKQVDPSLLKSIEPVDVSNIPEYLIESLYEHEGKFYRPSDVRKMITAAGSVAQALESQDLEEKITSLGQIKKQIKKLKPKKRAKNESKSNVEGSG